MKNVALIIKTNLRGKFSNAITKVILVSILLLFVCVKINIINVKYPIKMKAECIQFFACRKKIHPMVVVEETRMMLLALVSVNSCITENKVPKMRSVMVL